MARCEDPLVGGQCGGGTHNVAADGLKDGWSGRRPRRRVAGRLLAASDALLPASCCHRPHFLIFLFPKILVARNVGDQNNAGKCTVYRGKTNSQM
jgi:hypothetical protein